MDTRGSVSVAVRRLLAARLALGLGAFAAGMAGTPAAPVASFTFSPASPITGTAVAFRDSSSNHPTAWSWSFGDGTTSSAQNPTHSYAAAGTFKIALKAANAGGSGSASQSITAIVPAPVASFSFSPAAPTAGAPVEFQDSSTGKPTSWAWTFGDGCTSTQQDPSHAFAAPGSYKVTQKAANGSGSTTASSTVKVGEAAPTGIAATAGDGQAAVSWSAAAGATSYNLYWAAGKTVTPGTGRKLAGVVSPCTVPGLADGTSYAFVVTAVGAGVESPASVPATATPAKPPAPVAFARKAIWGGGRESVALKADGTVWNWGLNENGILGIGVGDPTWTNLFSSADRDVPTQVLGPLGAGHLASITRIMGCEHDNFALKSDGTLWSWGYNGQGELGIGSLVDSCVPVKVSGLSSVVSLGGRGYHALAVKADGTVWAWGIGTSGQLGNGATGNSSVPVQVKGLSNPALVSGGGFFSLALMPDGTVMAWGANESGQLGNGSYTPSSVPVKVPGLTGVVQVAGGWQHAVALRSDGTVWAWGSNYWGGYNGATFPTGGGGMLGDGTTSNSLVPKQVPGLSGIIDISAGDSFTAVLKSDGTVWAFGCNGVGQCGTGAFSQEQLTPRQVPGLSGVAFVNARDHHCLSVKADGSIWCWGSGTMGELGNGKTEDSSVPVETRSF